MAANPLEHRNWGNSQSWPRPHHHLVAFLSRFQKLEVDLNTMVLESLHTVTSVASVQLFGGSPSWQFASRRGSAHTTVAELWKDQSSCQFYVVTAAAAETDAAGGGTE